MPASAKQSTKQSRSGRAARRAASRTAIMIIMKKKTEKRRADEQRALFVPRRSEHRLQMNMPLDRSAARIPYFSFIKYSSLKRCSAPARSLLFSLSFFTKFIKLRFNPSKCIILFVFVSLSLFHLFAIQRRAAGRPEPSQRCRVRHYIGYYSFRFAVDGPIF